MNEIEMRLRIDDSNTVRHYESGFQFKDIEEFDNLFETLKLSIRNSIELNVKKSTV